jgi:2-keto-3-deoxy-L-fuconate dehydrogenase
MANRMVNKTAVVTAAGNGIGRATAAMFSLEGAKVFAADIDEVALASIPNVTACRLDVTDRGAVRRLAADIGAIDVLFNCAGLVQSGTILQSSEEELEYALNLNVRSMYHLIRAFLPAMLTQGGGSIINMSSVASSLKGVPNRFAYSLTKAAVIGLTKSVAADFVGQGIRCNAICPGTVQTPSLDVRIRTQAAASGRREEEVRSEFVARQPMGRLGEVDEIAYLATYLASDESNYTTGQVHIIDGGWLN